MSAKGEDVEAAVVWAERAVGGGLRIVASDDARHYKVAAGLLCDGPCLQAAGATVGRAAFAVSTLPAGPVMAWEWL